MERLVEGECWKPVRASKPQHVSELHVIRCYLYTKFPQHVSELIRCYLYTKFRNMVRGKIHQGAEICKGGKYPQYKNPDMHTKLCLPIKSEH